MDPVDAQTKVVIICGPTAAGKTAAAIAVGSACGGEVINADSMQIYRRMDIGTAKPTAAERAALPHHLIDIVEPDQPFDAARYARVAAEAIAALAARGVLPLVVGGTGLYIRALRHGLCAAPAPEPALRRELLAEARQAGSAALHARLASLDPAAAARMHPNDRSRVIRALEVHLATGRSIDQLQRRHGFARERYAVLSIGLDLPRAELYARIDRRVEAMLDAGLEREVRTLLERGYHAEHKPMQAIGYRHMLALIQGRMTRSEAVAAMARDTRRYAKRQLTWFRADPSIHWVAPDAHAAMIALVRRFRAGELDTAAAAAALSPP
jgi:tRNA dimethylallyltransferase